MVDLESFKQDGYIKLKDFLPSEEVSQLKSDALFIFEKQLQAKGIYSKNRSELEKLEELFKKDFHSFVSCGKHIQHMFSLHRLALSPKIERVIRLLGIEFPNICTRPVLYFNHHHLAKEEVYHTVFAHQDWRSMQGSINSIVCWLPLVDVDINLGALEIIPKSHLSGLITENVDYGFGRVTSYKDIDFTPVELKVGDALFFNSFLVHRSGRNSSQKIRWSCHFRYNDMQEKTFISRGFPHPYLYKPQDDLITPDFNTTRAILDYFEKD